MRPRGFDEPVSDSVAIKNLTRLENASICQPAVMVGVIEVRGDVTAHPLHIGSNLQGGGDAAQAIKSVIFGPATLRGQDL